MCKLEEWEKDVSCCNCIYVEHCADCISDVRCDDYKDKSRFIELPCKVGDKVRFKGLSTQWTVTGLHFYDDGTGQINVTNGKITDTMSLNFFKEAIEVIKDKSRYTELPCKVGDTVYKVLDIEWEVGEFQVYRLTYIFPFYKTSRFYAECHSHDNVGDIWFLGVDVGKTIFLTREEAEAKLKEVQG